MLHGVVLISIPCALFVAEFARPLVTVLFQRGQFTPEAAILTSDILRISAFSLIISSVLAPMARLFQILDRISYSHVLYLVSLVCTAAFQYVLVFRMGWDVYGIAWASLANSAVVTLVVAGLVRRCGAFSPGIGCLLTRCLPPPFLLQPLPFPGWGRLPLPACQRWLSEAGCSGSLLRVLFPGAPPPALDCWRAAVSLTATDKRLYCLCNQNVWPAEQRVTQSFRVKQDAYRHRADERPGHGRRGPGGDECASR